MEKQSTGGSNSSAIQASVFVSVPFVAGIRLVFILQFSSYSNDYFLRYVQIPFVSLLPFLVEPLVEQELQYLKMLFCIDHGVAIGCRLYLAGESTGGRESCAGMFSIHLTCCPRNVVGAGH